MGKIISVDPNARTCRAKTVGLPGYTDDLDLQDVRILHNAWHGEGDEETFIPRANSYCAILFVGNEPFIIGYVPLQNASGTANPGSNYSQNLQPGDKTTATVAGNRITLRSGGALEVISTLGCRTYYIPTIEMVYTLCQQWELDTNGGYLHWDNQVNDTSTPPGATLFDLLAFDNVTPTKGTRIQMGLSQENQLPFELAVGPITPDTQTLDTENVLIQAREDGVFQLITALRTVFSSGPQTGGGYAVTSDFENGQFSILTPLGHTLVFNDTADDSSVALMHASGARMQMDSTGAISFVDSSNNQMTLDASGLTISTADGHTTTMGSATTIGSSDGKTTLAVAADGSINGLSPKAVTFSAPTGSFSTDTTYIGSNAAQGAHAVLYEMLKMIFDQHTHLTAVGPSGPPTPPITMALMELTPVTSAKAGSVKLKGNLF